MSKLVLNISKIDSRDIDIAGKYAVELGELSHIGIPIPEGFVITVSCFKEFLTENKFILTIPTQKQIMHAVMSKDIASQINKSYKELGNVFKEKKVILTPSSPFDFKNIHYEVKGDANLIIKIKEIWAAQFSKISLLENTLTNINNLHKLNIAIVVQKKIVGEKNGILFTEDPHTADKTIIHIKHRSMISNYSISKNNLNIIFKGHLSKANWSHKISDQEAIELASIGKKLEKYFYFPQEVKFSIDKNKIYILETKTMMRTFAAPVSYDSLPYLSNKPKVKRKIFLKGKSNFPGIATGPVKILSDFKNLENAVPGQIIVAPKIETVSFPRIKKAAALITENISFAGADKILYERQVARPSIFNVKNATKILHTGNVITVDGAKGEIYRGGFT